MARLLFTYTFTSNGKHTVNVFENRIEIEHHGLKNRIVKGTSGKIIIYLSKLSAIEIKNTGLVTGYVEFLTSGFSHTSETLDKMKKDNIIEFDDKQENRIANDLVEIINDLI